MNIDKYVEELNQFEHVKFYADGHKYLINEKEAKSVTSILKNFVKPFDKDYWANYKAKKEGVEVTDILELWERKSKISQMKGSIVHSYIESQLTGIDFSYPEETLVEIFGHDPIQDSFNQIVTLVDGFINDIDNKMIPLASELVIGDYDYLVGGTIDQVFYNKKSNMIEIWDWKTNKEIKTISQYYHLAPLDNIPDTELDHYSLQLALYRLIIKRNTSLEIGNSYITWFNETNSKYQIFKARDYEEYAKLILDTI